MITFDQDGAETILVVMVDYATNELKKQHAAMGFVNGFSYALTKLDAAIGYITQA